MYIFISNDINLDIPAYVHSKDFYILNQHTKEWKPITTYNRLAVPPIHSYDCNSLNPDNMGFSLPNTGTLFFSYTPIIAILNPEDEEYYYKFGWGAAWYTGEDMMMPASKETTLQDALLDLNVEFIDDPNDVAAPFIISNSNYSNSITLSNVSSGSILQWNNNFNWVPSINIKI